MSFSRVQGTGFVSSGDVSSQGGAFSSNVVSGNFIIVNASGFHLGSGALTLSVTDSQGNTYTRDISSTTNYSAFNVQTNAIFRTQASSSGALTVTVAASQSSYLAFGIEEFSSSSGSIFLDTTASQSNPLTGSVTPATTAMTLAATDLVVAGFYLNTTGATYTAGSGFTLDYTSNAAFQAIVTEYQLATSSPVTPSCTSTFSAGWNAVAAAYSSAALVVTAVGTIAANPDTFAGASPGSRPRTQAAIINARDAFAGLIQLPPPVTIAMITVHPDVFAGISTGTPPVTSGAVVGGLDSFIGFGGTPSVATSAVTVHADAFAGIGSGIPGGIVMASSTIMVHPDTFAGIGLPAPPVATSAIQGGRDTFAGVPSSEVIAVGAWTT